MKAEIHRISDIGKLKHTAIHCWLRKIYGNAIKCEHCGKENKKYEYALIHGEKYEKDRNNFIMLCRSCHRKYDFQNRYPNNIKRVLQFDLHGNLINKYDSITIASRKTGILIGSIGNCLTGLSKTAGNFKWKYYEQS